MSAVIEVRGLTRRFEELTATDGVEFGVQEGEPFGFPGPNGAGKTTAVGMPTGVLDPTDGTASIQGHDIRTEALLYYLKPPVLIFGVLFPVFFLASKMGRPVPAENIVLGMVAMALWFTASAAGPLVTPWERWAGTYERLIAAPVSLRAILTGDVVSGLLFGVCLSAVPVIPGLAGPKKGRKMLAFGRAGDYNCSSSAPARGAAHNCAGGVRVTRVEEACHVATRCFLLWGRMWAEAFPRDGSRGIGAARGVRRVRRGASGPRLVRAAGLRGRSQDH